jgi:hypothetical protein
MTVEECPSWTKNSGFPAAANEEGQMIKTETATVLANNKTAQHLAYI